MKEQIIKSALNSENSSFRHTDTQIFHMANLQSHGRRRQDQELFRRYEEEEKSCKS